jgi:hypothetical protein
MRYHEKKVNFFYNIQFKLTQHIQFHCNEHKDYDDDDDADAGDGVHDDYLNSII